MSRAVLDALVAAVVAVSKNATVSTNIRSNIPNTGEGDTLVSECPPGAGSSSAIGEKGGAPWLDHQTARPSSANSIFATSRRNSCAETTHIDAHSIRLRKAASAMRELQLPVVWREHGASNFPIDPKLSSNENPAIWRAEDNPQVIVLAAADCDAILATAAVVADEADDQERHLVLTERWQRYRLKVVQPVPGQKISYLLSADESLETRLTALQFFNSRPSGQTVSTVASPLRPTPYQSHRFLLMLKLLDALDEAAGKNPTTRELATILGLSQTGLRAIDWKTSSARRQTQRLVVEARQMAASGYRDLLSARGRRASQTP